MSKTLWYFVVPTILLIIWYVLTHNGLVSPLFLAGPGEVLQQLIVGIQNKTLLFDVGHTLYRMFFGFLLAVLIGVPLGLLMGYSSVVYRSLEFFVEFVRGIPVTALFPLFLLVFGIGDDSKIAVTAWGAGLVMLINAMYGVHLGKELRIRVARSMRVRGVTLFWKVILPEALPQIFSGFRVALSLSLVLVIVTEMFIGTTNGLGRRIIDAQLVYRTADMYAAILVTGLLGFILNKFAMFAEARIVHWKGK